MTIDLEPVDWNDLRLCLEVARSGAVSTAARNLGVSHSTVLRRIAALEGRLGVTLFMRRSNGYEATDAGRNLAESAGHIEERISRTLLDSVAYGNDMSGSIRFAVPDLAAWALAPVLKAFSSEHPSIELSLLAGQTPESLSRGDAHVALVLTGSAPQGQIGADLGPAAFATYGSREISIDTGQADHAWVGLPPGLRHAPVGALEENARLGYARKHQVSNFALQYAAIVGGLGLGLLPCGVADRDDRLRRFESPVVDSSLRLWLLCRRELRDNVRVTAFFRYLRHALRREKALIAGEKPLT